MKILLISSFFSPVGGVETILFSTSQLLKECGHEVYFFSTDKQPYFDGNYPYSQFFPAYIDFKSLKGLQKINYFKIFYNFEAKRKLKEYLKEIKPDLVHIHITDYYLTSSVVDACYDYGAPIIKTFHELRFICPGSKYLKDAQYCDLEACIKGNPVHCLLNKCKNNSYLESFFVVVENLVNRTLKIYDKFDHCIFPSNAMAVLAIKAGFNKDKLSVLNNFTDERFIKEGPEFANKGYYLYAGRLSEEKGLKYLLKAMAELPEIQLHIVGQGPQEQELKDLADKYGLKNVIFKGQLGGNDLISEYKYCIATILPCNWFEIFGVTILESFAVGKPVIASRIGAIPEIVTDGQEGLLVAPGDVDELKQAISRLFADNDLVKQMGQKARRKVEECYRPKNYIDRLDLIYNQVLSLKS